MQTAHARESVVQITDISDINAYSTQIYYNNNKDRSLLQGACSLTRPQREVIERASLTRINLFAAAAS